jgi:cytochrome c biogenesis protein
LKFCIFFLYREALWSKNMDDTETDKLNGQSKINVIDSLWRLFSSVKLALTLILVIGAMSLFGALKPDVDVFHSWVFLLAGTLLMINVIVCSLNRWKNIRYSLHGGQVKQSEKFFTAGNRAEIKAIPLSFGDSSGTLKRVLQKLGYRVREVNEKESIYIAADKNRYFRLGTYVSHLSLVLFVLAYLLGGYLGFRDTNFAVAEGTVRDVGHNTGLSLGLVSFVDEYYPDGMPKDYRSQVILYEDGQEVRQGLIRVNHPLVYKGTRFYQSYFGPSIQLEISMDGQEMFNNAVTLDQTSVSGGILRSVGVLGSADGTMIRIVGSGGGTDTMIPPGYLAVQLIQNETIVGMDLVEQGVPVNIGGLDILYSGDGAFSGFQVSRDPSNSLVWIASGLFLLGLTMVFYFPYRQVWAVSQAVKPGNSRILIRAGTGTGTASASIIDKLTHEMEKELHKNG